MSGKTILRICWFFLFVLYSSFINAQNIKDLIEQSESYKASGDINSEIQVLNKLAFMQWENGKYLDASESFKRIIELNRSLNNKNGMHTATINLGAVYHDAEIYDLSFNAYIEAIAIAKEMNKKNELFSDITNAATALQGSKKYSESNDYVNEALVIAKELNDLKKLRTCYRILAENYEKMGNTNKTLEYYDMFNTYDKQIKNQQINQVKEESQIEVSKAQAEKKAKELELKQTNETLKEVKEISELQKLEINLLNQQKEIEKLKSEELETKLAFRKKIIGSITGGLIAVLALLIIISFQFSQKRKANLLLAEQNNKINRQNKQIRDSISYAQTIQRAILPIPENIDQCFDSFIIFKPKDMVSGDFYWFSNMKDEKKCCLAVVDCTGHGVPGAFMSMIGNTMLNNIVNEHRIFKPSKILQTLHEDTVGALKQHTSENKDGMDVCLCMLEKLNDNKVKMIFAGAKRPMLRYNKQLMKIEIYKGDRISIGGVKRHIKEINFIDQEIILNSGDIIYLSSDGFIDQNAPDRKRFGSNKLMSILINIAPKPMKIQQEILEKELSEYMNTEDQRDDITLIGIKI